MHFEQLILAILAAIVALTFSACTMSVTFSPLDTIDNKQSWKEAKK